MIFEAKKITLKNGTIAILKTPEVCDAEMLLKNVITASSETNFLSRYTEDWEGFTVEDEEKWISGNRESDNNLIISCYIDCKVVGSCDITFFKDIKTSHRAGIGIAILKDYWNIGIGSAMFSELIKIAKEYIGTEFLSLNILKVTREERLCMRNLALKPLLLSLKSAN